VAVLWRSGRVVITYEDGSHDSAIADASIAEGIATDAHLILASGPDGTVRWESPAI
jgi:hypothetical protein